MSPYAMKFDVAYVTSLFLLAVQMQKEKKGPYNSWGSSPGGSL